MVASPPPIGISLGDPNGVGAEILLKAWEQGVARGAAVFGDARILTTTRDNLGLATPILTVGSPAEARADALCVVESAPVPPDGFRPGEITAAAGAAARAWVVAATEAAIRAETSAVVTLPVSKEAIHLTDPDFTGHTELIARLCGAEKVAMMLATEALRVVLLTTHVPLHRALALVTRPRILDILRTAHAFLLRLTPAPRIAVAGLNPHGGEHGLFGTEEQTIIGPAVEDARAEGIRAEGPFSPDTLFHFAVRDHRWDAVLAMYHDQGLIPLKLIGFGEAVNVTLGLPIVRTSVDHGTAFDIAGQGRASTTSFVAAVRFAERLGAGRSEGA